MRKITTIFSILMVFAINLSAQKQNYYPAIIGFYNLENLYDTVNNPIVDDEEFLPESERNYNTRVYFDKLSRLASVVSKMGTEVNPDGLAFLGVAEIENDTVLTDLIKQPLLKDRKWKFEHYDSPDKRGVDVGFLYNPKYFKVISSEKLFVKLPGGSKDSYFTRDILYVKGTLVGDTVHVFVNHWPSRSGGEERSIPARAAAAGVCRAKVDSIMLTNADSKVVIMGDLNDDPISPSVTKTIGAKGKIKDVKRSGIYNPWLDFYKKGIGTLAYQDAWGLFDQVLLSEAWLSKEQKGFHFHKAHIFNQDFMVQKTGKFRGYAKRTWDGITYNYGYSDHFPVYITLLKIVN
jgi:hypothetical protein